MLYSPYFQDPKEFRSIDSTTAWRSNWAQLTAKDLMEKTYFVPETMSALSALEEMQRRRVHMAVVVDEYGGTAGLVTFEDILEEVS